MTEYILLTRPLEDAKETARAIEALGFAVLTEPLLQIEYIDVALPDLCDYQALVFTSANAVRAVRPQDSERIVPVYCVGEQTAKAARAAGWQNVKSAGGDARVLSDLLEDEDLDGERPLLHLSGEDIARPVDVAGLQIERVVVYKARAAAALGGDIISHIDKNEVRAALFFSARTAQIFADLLAQTGRTDAVSTIKALCLSETVVKSLSHLPWQDVRVAQRPERKALVDLLAEQEPRKGWREMAAMNEKNGDDALYNAEEIIERFGGIRPMANKMDVPVTTVQGWKKRNVIPGNRRDKVMEAAEDNNIDITDLMGAAANENTFSSEIETAVRTQDAATDKRHEEAVLKAARVSVPFEEDGHSRNDQMMAELRKAQSMTFTKSAGFAIVLVAVATILSAAFLWPTKQEVRQNSQKLAQLGTDFSVLQEGQSLLRRLIPGDLEQRFDNARHQAETLQKQVGELSAQVEGLSSDIANPNISASEKIQRVAERVTAIAGPSQLTDMLQKVQQMQQSIEGQTQLSAAIADLQALFSGAQAQGGDLEEMLQQAQTEDDALGQTLQGVAPQDLKAAALLLGMTQFRSSVNRSEAFGEDLALMEGMLAKDDPELQAAIERLAPKAESGVLTPAGLKGEFKGLAGEIVVASLKGEDVSVQERAKARFNDLLSVEKDGELITGTDTQAVVARAQTMLDEGDIQGAIAELQSLEGEAQTTAQPFIDEAQATLLAEQLQGMFTGRILDRLHGGASSGLNTIGVPANGIDIQSLIREVEKLAPRRVIRVEGTDMMIMEPKKQIVPQ